MNIAKAEPNNINIYEDLLSLLTFQQALKLECEIDWCTVKKFVFSELSHILFSNH